MNFEVIGQAVENAKIKVVGVGGGGGNAVVHMINHNIEGVDFICANTDTQALSTADGAITLKLGNGLTKGLGAGADPDVGRRAAESDRTAIEELLAGADMIFITAGMGGGTGTGAAPVIASIAKDLGALTVAVVTKPFKFEGKKRMGSAEKGLAALYALFSGLGSAAISCWLKLKNCSGDKPYLNLLGGSVQKVKKVCTSYSNET